jgi:pimeloyl-ACP methyl ester carboxylesterase
MTTRTYAVAAGKIGPVGVTLSEYGSGQPFLLLHGGAGPQSVTGFAELFAATHDVRVLVPVHPGFGGTPRPEVLASVPGLAALYLSLLDQLDLADVTVIGNSVGGWITAEIALLKSPRVSGIVLIDAVGIEVPGHPVADFFSLTMDQVFDLSFHDPGKFRIDPTTLPPAAQAAAAGNRAALAAYAGSAMSDPALTGRLGSLEIPTLVLWGDSDRIVDADYGRAYAAAIPMARFQLLPDTGHSPQLETPDQVSRAIWDSADTDLSAAPADATNHHS